MKTLLLMRHAKAESDSPDGSDFSRELASRGKRDARSMGKAVRKLDLLPEEIWVSPAVRTRETLEEALDGMKHTPVIHFDERIYEASAETLLSVVRSIGGTDRAMIIGHNPGMELLAAVLTNSQQECISFSTSTLGQFELGIDSWDELSQGCGKLTLLIDPQTATEL